MRQWISIIGVKGLTLSRESSGARVRRLIDSGKEEEESIGACGFVIDSYQQRVRRIVVGRDDARRFARNGFIPAELGGNLTRELPRWAMFLIIIVKRVGYLRDDGYRELEIFEIGGCQSGRDN